MLRPLILLLLAFGAMACGDTKQVPHPPSGEAGPPNPPDSGAQRPQDAQVKKAAKLLAEARELKAAMRYAEAKERYRQAAELDPSGPARAEGDQIQVVDIALAREAARKVKQGRDYQWVQRPLLAFREFRDARILDPNNEEAANNEADIGLEIRRFHDTMDHYQAVLERNPTSLRAILNGSLAAYRAGDYQRCVQFLENMNGLEDQARKDPKVAKQLSEIWFMRGIAASKVDRIPEAVASLEKASRHEPEVARYQFFLAGVYLDDGQFELAIRSMKACLDLDPNYEHAHYNLAMAHDRLGQYEKAIAYYREALRRDKSLWLAAIHAARCHEKLGATENLMEAQNFLEQALTMNPLSHEAMHTMQSILRRLGRSEEADVWGERFQRIRGLGLEQEERLRDLAKRIRKDPGDIEARLEGIAIQEKFHHWKDAMESVRSLLNYDPKNFSGLQRMCALLMIERDFRSVYFEAQKLIEYRPDDSSGYSLAAGALCSMEQWNEAIPLAEKAWSLNNDDLHALRSLIAAYQKVGGKEETLKALAPHYRRLEAIERVQLEQMAREEQERKQRLLDGY